MGEVGTHSEALEVSQGSSRAHPVVGVQVRNWQALNAITHHRVMSNSLNLQLNSKSGPLGLPGPLNLTQPLSLHLLPLFIFDLSKFSLLSLVNDILKI